MKRLPKSIQKRLDFLRIVCTKNQRLKKTLDRYLTWDPTLLNQEIADKWGIRHNENVTEFKIKFRLKNASIRSNLTDDQIKQRILNLYHKGVSRTGIYGAITSPMQRPKVRRMMDKIGVPFLARGTKLKGDE